MKQKQVERAREKAPKREEKASPKHWIPYPIGKVLKELEFDAKKKGEPL